MNRNDGELVSVALCTYNGEKFLTAQINSILKQTWQNLELVIVDDASTDSTVSIIRNFQEQDPRIRLVINEENIGLNKNFERAFGLCRGNMIAISDQDDIWDTEKIEKMIKSWPADSSLVYCLTRIFFGKEFRPVKETPGPSRANLDDTRKIVFGSDAVGHASIFRRSLLKYALPFPENVYYDWWLCMHAANQDYVSCVPEVLTWHRRHEDNSSQKINRMEDRQQKLALRRDQYAALIETFFSRTGGREAEKKSLLTYASLLRKMDGKHFSREMFQYVLKNRKFIFHYRKKPFFSHLKHAFRMGYTGLVRD